MLKNRRAWDLRTRVHLKSEFYDVASFKQGRNSLRPIELEELGDVCGHSLLHLQCHFGMDTLSWARLGARVTGTDFSEEAITAARSLATEVGLEAHFICANPYDLPEVLDEEFDIVVTTYGVISWLPDLSTRDIGARSSIHAQSLQPTAYFASDRRNRASSVQALLSITGALAERGQYRTGSTCNARECRLAISPT